MAETGQETKKEIKNDFIAVSILKISFEFISFLMMCLDRLIDFLWIDQRLREPIEGI